ncbi:DUF6882 domain-containing protein [Streptomyces radicis]|nr:DUF6882 domain-containing protein [Streptomyces radicis]
MSTFSDALLALARPRLAWVSEQLDLFDTLVPHGATRFDLDAPSLWRGGVTLRGHVLGTYALDGAWLWAWGNDSLAGTRGAQLSASLREIGEWDDVPELAGRTLDLTGFPDPRLAAHHLLLICMGLLDARGAAVCALNERGLALLVTDDPAVPRAEPRPRRLVDALLAGPALLPGRDASVAVKGWFARHGVKPSATGEGFAGRLPEGDTVTVTLGGGAVREVSLTGADGGPAALAAADEQELIDPRRDEIDADRCFPAPLLMATARSIAYSLRETAAMVDYAGEHLGFEGRPPVWDAAAGELRFPGGALAARALGSYDLGEGWFAWAPGTEDIRAAYRAAAGLPEDVDIPELADGRLELAPYLTPEALAVGLTRAAATCAGLVFTSLGGQFLAVTDARVTGRDLGPSTFPDAAAAEAKAGASWLHGQTPADERPRVMRAVAEAYFTRLGRPVHGHGLPDFLSGEFGLYEVRVHFAPDGTLGDATTGMMWTPH